MCRRGDGRRGNRSVAASEDAMVRTGKSDHSMRMGLYVERGQRRRRWSGGGIAGERKRGEGGEGRDEGHKTE